MLVIERRNARPEAPRGIAGHPDFGRDLGLFVHTRNGQPYEFANVTPPSANSGVIVGTPTGLAVDISGSQTLDFATRDSFSATGPMTLAALVDIDALTSSSFIMGCAASSTGPGWEFRVGSGSTNGKLFFLRSGPGSGLSNVWAWETSAAGDRVAAGDRNVFIAVSHNSTVGGGPSPVFYVNGAEFSGVNVVLGGSYSGSWAASASTLKIGRRVDGGTQLDGRVHYAYMARRAFNAGEIQALRAYLLQNERRIWVPVSAGGSSPVTITTGIGAATASGTTAVVNRAQTIATGTGAASAAGVQAIINRAQFIAATIGAATASGTTASVNLARFVATGIGAATAAGTQASIVADGAVVITTGIGAATAAGVQARIDLARFIATGIGAATASGTQATITNAADVVVSTGIGAATADGAAATFIRNVLVACGVGNATADGTQATVIGEGLEPAETRRRGGGNRFVLARKRLPSAYLIDWLTNEEPSEETKRVIREIKAGRPLPERLDPPKVEKQITPEQLAAKLIPRRLINLSEVLPVEQTQLIRKAVRIAQERDDEDILMLL